MSDPALSLLPARSGKAVRLARGRSLKVVNSHGQQVVDAWAFNADDLGEFMSMEHLRQVLGRIIPRTGDPLATNHRRPILTLVEDTSPGVHDTLMAACDVWRYRISAATGHHANCRDNLFAAMAELGLTPPECPSPLNLWMNIPVRRGRGDRLAAAGEPARRLRGATRRARLRRRDVGLPAGHGADQRRRDDADRGAFPDSRLTLKMRRGRRTPPRRLTQIRPRSAGGRSARCRPCRRPCRSASVLAGGRGRFSHPLDLLARRVDRASARPRASGPGARPRRARPRRRRRRRPRPWPAAPGRPRSRAASADHGCRPSAGPRGEVGGSALPSAAPTARPIAPSTSGCSLSVWRRPCRARRPY